MPDNTFLEFGFETGLQPCGPGQIWACWSGMNPDGTPNPAVQGVAGAPNDGQGKNFIIIPTGRRIDRIYGTSTIKVPGIELLFRIVAGYGNDFDSIVQLHHITARLNGEPDHTLQFDYGNLAATPYLTGDGGHGLWLEWQGINASGVYTGVGRAFEHQVNIETVPA